MSTLAQAGQVAIVATGTAQQLPNVPFGNQYVGVTLFAKTGNTADIAFGPTAAVTESTGALLEDGEQVTLALTNLNQYYIVGTEGDVLSYMGS